MNKFREKQNFHALDKFHLNNSVQDETYACESICSDLNLAAGVPATRVTHAHVWINDRDLGLYVLKEGFDKPFLKRHFPKPNGNLYDGGFLRDVDADLEKDGGTARRFQRSEGSGHGLSRAGSGAPLALVAKSLDVDSFLRFMADRTDDVPLGWLREKPQQLPHLLRSDRRQGPLSAARHGPDVLGPGLSDARLSRPPRQFGRHAELPNGANCIVSDVEMLLPLYSAEALARNLMPFAAKLQPTLAAISLDADRRHADRCRELRERLVARAANLREQLNQPDPVPVEFDEQRKQLRSRIGSLAKKARMRSWNASNETAGWISRSRRAPPAPASPRGGTSFSWHKVAIVSKLE